MINQSHRKNMLLEKEAIEDTLQELNMLHEHTEKQVALYNLLEQQLEEIETELNLMG